MTSAVEEAGTETLRPIRAFELRVSAVQQLSPHFRRITFTGPDLELFGSNAEGRTLDLRIKLMLPSPGHPLPELSHVCGSLQEDWYHNWRMLDESVRGVMRTFTVRSLRRGTPGSDSLEPVPAELDIDFALHLDGVSGPASEWAAEAQPGDAMTIIGPCARWGECVGIEFVPGFAQRVLLVGDETAVPAVAAILESLPAHVGGHAVLEVPEAADFQEMSTSSGVEVRWLARGVGAHGGALAAEVRSVVVPAACDRGEDPEDVDIDSTILWETPAAATGHGLYAWIAGEAAVIRDLRRYLVREVGMDRNAVAFMGYWRQGQALPG